MKKIDSNFDELLNANYDLYSVKLSELKKEVKSWYGELNFDQFDDRHVSRNDGSQVKEMRKSGVLTNYFFAYKEDNKFYLMDGFNRLLSKWGDFEEDTTVYLKVITDKLKDHELMGIMFRLNMWKLNDSRSYFHTKDFLDRGFRIFLYSKFGITLDNYDDYHTRKRDNKDNDILDYYFRAENNTSGNYKLEYNQLVKLFSNKRIIDDIKEILEYNNYKGEPFYNYTDFFRGFVMFISWRRLKSDERELKFKTYLDLLRSKKAFFKKLQGMSRTDSTRKNIYKFYRETENILFIKRGYWRKEYNLLNIEKCYAEDDKLIVVFKNGETDEMDYYKKEFLPKDVKSINKKLKELE